MRIPPHIIDQVRSQANIVDIVGERVQLRKAGRNYLGLCPFHNEKTPSFNVNAERGIFKCFGCSKAGNVITFIEEIDKVGFVDAVRWLAQKLGIVIPEDEREDPTGVYARRDSATAAMKAAVEYYMQYLHLPEGSTVAEYLSKRGFDDTIMASFAIGASPNSWDGLLRHLHSQGFTNDQLNDAGLIVVNESGRTYDRFRGRAMFPIRDDYGRPVGFTARDVTGDGQAKYINSPQGILYDKSRVLYGLDLAKRSISNDRIAVIVEGQADVVTMHQHGFTSTIATSGTALTPEHLKLLKKYADTIVLVFDADKAGQNATTRAIELGLESGLDVKCVQLPADSDPDSLLRNEGREFMTNLLTSAAGWLAYQTTRLEQLGYMKDPVLQAKAVKTMVGWISKVPDSLQHPFLVRDLAKAFHVDEMYLIRELNGTVGKPSQSPVPYNTSQPSQAKAESRNVKHMQHQEEFVHPGEKELFKHVLSFEDGVATLLNRLNISEEQFITESGKRILRRIIINDAEHHDVVGPLLNDEELTGEERNFLANLSFDLPKVSVNWEKYGADIIPYDTTRPMYDALYAMLIDRCKFEVQQLLEQLATVVDEDLGRRIVHRISVLEQGRVELQRRKITDSEYAQWLLGDIQYPS